MVESDSVEGFVSAHTRIASPVLCPEILLHVADDMESLWAHQESVVGRTGLPPPFWCLPWVGGQALARYTLDHPMLVRNQSVLDVGSGSGICAIAAAKAGAHSVAAYDVDAFSRDVLAMNARINHVHIDPLCDDVIGVSSRWDVVLVGDPVVRTISRATVERMVAEDRARRKPRSPRGLRSRLLPTSSGHAM